MNFKRIFSAFLTLVMVFGSVVIADNAAEVEIYAADEIEATEEEDATISYLTDAYETPQAKIADMTLMKQQYGYKLYVEEYTGEIAFEDTKTGEILFSNPYDIAQAYAASSPNKRHELLSQISLTFEENGKAETKTMHSYTEAALRNQIVTKRIKGGARVEYTIGELATQRLVPGMISKTRFEELISGKVTDPNNFERLMSYYTLYDTSDIRLTEREVKEIHASFPITRTMAIYVRKPDMVSEELKRVEAIIKTYSPTYTFEEMEQDHADCDYVASEEAPPNFRMAIEYTINEDGLEARLPANGIRFDESHFTLKEITLLPYMGSGSNLNTGYTFLPDGSGTLFRFEDLYKVGYNISGEVYGKDFAKHLIDEQRYETMRLPVFGLVENRKVTTTTTKPGMNAPTESQSIDDRGFFAVITEGDSMAKLKTSHGGIEHAYHSVFAIFEPRPSDQYSLSTATGTGSGGSGWTVTSSRRYMGSYKIQYYMLDDKAKVEEAGKGYEASYLGMAEAYRDYLEGNGYITKLDAKNTSKDMPIYIESFGSIETSDKFMSLPITVDTALTSFSNIRTMYDELSKAGVSNINFKLTGYYNGGLEHTYPVDLAWIDSLGGEDGLRDLFAYAKDKSFGVYPDFDLAYVHNSDWFDGVDEKEHLVKSIDDRYMSKREYDAAMQTYESTFAMAISPSVYSHFLGEIGEDLKGFGDMNSISVSTLGTDLNSDFDEEDPYNREDSKKFTQLALESLSDKYNVMVNGGNAYAISYADHLINIPTESSNFQRAAVSVPFYAMVLHGYVNYTGSAINMEGDLKYARLKSLENGASLYFTLCYDNTSALKGSDKYNKYYSVSFEDWKDELVEYYNELNGALGDLQTECITDHSFINASRVVSKETENLTEAELEALEKEEAAEKEAEKAWNEREQNRKKLAESRGESYTPVPYPKNRGNNNNGSDANSAERVAVVYGSVVSVTYEGGTTFIINYNSYDVEAEFNGEKIAVEALSFVELNANEKGGDK